MVDQYWRYHRFGLLFPRLRPAEGTAGNRRSCEALGIIGTVDLQTVERFKAESDRHRIEVRARLGIPPDSLLALRRSPALVQRTWLCT